MNCNQEVQTLLGCQIPAPWNAYVDLLCQSKIPAHEVACWLVWAILIKRRGTTKRDDVDPTIATLTQSVLQFAEQSTAELSKEFKARMVRIFSKVSPPMGHNDWPTLLHALLRIAPDLTFDQIIVLYNEFLLGTLTTKSDLSLAAKQAKNSTVSWSN